jgi:hypothetical protein
MKQLTLTQELENYIKWCVDNHKKPQDFENLKSYIDEKGGQ